MEISETRLKNLANTNARAKVMVKQWYPELFEDRGVETPTQMGIIQTLREAQPVRQGTLRRGIRRDANGDALVIGTWYTDNENHLMIYSGDLAYSKGFYDGNWGTTWIFPHPESSVPATQELLQVMLRKECEIRGYTSSNFQPIAGRDPRDFPMTDWYYDIEKDSMYTAPWGRGGYCMYKKGVWANFITGSLTNSNWIDL